MPNPSVLQYNTAAGTGNLSATLSANPVVGNLAIVMGNLGDGLGNGQYNSPYTNETNNGVRSLGGYASVTTASASAYTGTMSSNNDDAVSIIMEVENGPYVTYAYGGLVGTIAGTVITTPAIQSEVGDLILFGIAANNDGVGNYTATFSSPSSGSIVAQAQHSGGGPNGASLAVVAVTATSTSTSTSVTVSSAPTGTYSTVSAIVVSATEYPRMQANQMVTYVATKTIPQMQANQMVVYVATKKFILPSIINVLLG